jgi:hypothetical protein
MLWIRRGDISPSAGVDRIAPLSNEIRNLNLQAGLGGNSLGDAGSGICARNLPCDRQIDCGGQVDIQRLF